jgi:DNA-binding protein HU-beta
LAGSASRAKHQCPVKRCGDREQTARLAKSPCSPAGNRDSVEFSTTCESYQMATRPAPSKKSAPARKAAAKMPAPAARKAKSAVAPATKSAAAPVVTLKSVFEQLGETHELPKKQAHAVTQHLKTGARIRMSGLGILEVKTRSARMGRNPATGEAMQIKASKKVAFRPAKELKEAV